MHIDQAKMTRFVHDRSTFLRDHWYPERERRLGMKLALDIWYEAWGRNGDRNSAGAAGLGEAASVGGAALHDGSRRDRGGCHRGEIVGDVSPPLSAGP